jgi:SNF2 family DNA or RNA helicase
MIVKPLFRKLLLRLRDPLRVLGLIPQAKMIQYKGTALTVVPFEDDVVKVLRNMDIKNVPYPIEHYYDFPIRPGWTPMAHQIETAGFLSQHSRAYCLNDLGTAKTLSALWAYDYLRKEGKVKRVLVVSPLSTVERTWGDEIFTHLPHLSFEVLHGSKDKRIKLLANKPDVAIINHHGAKVIMKHLMRERFDVIIIDELSQAARNARSDMWKAINAIVQGRPYAWGMTGTPIPNSPMDAWAQCKLITPHTVPAYATHFRTKVMTQVTTYKWLPKPDALNTVYAAMQPGIRFKRDQVIDLPPTMYETRECKLTPEQSKAYKEMWDKSYTEEKGQGITAANEATRVNKLMQICCGVAIGDEHRVVFPPKPRLLELLQTIEEADAKVIVFVPFRGPLELIKHVVSKRYATEVIHGGVSKTKRDQVFHDFQNRPEPRVLVAQPAAMSHGLTLTEANVIVWFAPPNSAETYQQANGRITRPGQKRSQLIVHLQGTALERRVYKRLQDRTSMQGVLLDMFS